MKCAAALVFTLIALSPSSNCQSHPAKEPHTGASAAVPPFAGTWVLNIQRSTLSTRIGGISRAVIEYDGKTWHYIHTHSDGDDALPDSWQTTMTIGSPTPKITRTEEITFRAFMKKQGNDLLMTETGVTGRGQHLTNSVRYTLKDGGNTLVQTEVSTGPLGPRRTVYVLEREGAGAKAAAE